MIEIFLWAAVAVASFDLLLVIRNCRYLTSRPEAKVNRGLPTPRLVVILPVYQETETILDAIKFLKSSSCTLVDDVIIVGNARERSKNGINATVALAQAAAVDLPWLRVLECDTPDAIKAHQVNFAVESIGSNWDDCWIYVMDVDTRFGPENVDQLRAAILSGYRVIQQHTHFLESYDTNSFLGKTFAAHQTRWTLAHEISRIWMFNTFRLGVYHLVGHGLCINAALFKSLGGFSEKVKIEDIHFGYMCCMRGIKVYSVPLLEGSDTPSDLGSLWQQQYGWSLGAFQIKKYWNMLLESGYQPKFFNFLQNAFCAWNYIRWIGQSVFIWFLITLAAFDVHRSVVFVFFAIYFGSFLVAGISLRASGYFGGNPVAFALYGVLNSLYRSLPVIHCFSDQVRGFEKTKYKTRHRKL
jgi:cellulose synthase/poly-beta-1,6-N-acetylglucosamine synthase-like glycosyltransferase